MHALRRSLVLALLVPLMAACGPERPPNVLLISIDTLRSDHLSCYGYHRNTSPRLDAFAEDAALFENAYAQAPFTLTSHMSMFTSLFPETHGVEEDRRLRRPIPLVTEQLADAGYATVGFHNAKWLSGGYGFARGFERYEEHDSGETTRREVLATLPTLAAAENPFFLFVHFMDVHCTSLERRVKPVYDSPPRFRDAFLPHPDVGLPPRPNLHVYKDLVKLTREQRENLVARYDGGILYADWLVGEILDELRALDLYESSLIVVTSDHGESLGDHGVFAGHGLLWENGLRVPLLVKLPRAHAQRESWRGRRFEHRVQSVDIAPTILSVAGLPTPPSFEGRSLLEPGDRVVFAHRLPPGKPGVRSMILDGYKLKGNPWGWTLYDLRDDPTEARPLNAERPRILRRMRNKLWAQAKRMRRKHERLGGAEPEIPMTLDDDARERLKALGYLQ